MKITDSDLKVLRKKGFLNIRMDAMPGQLANNIGASIALTNLSADVIEVFTAKRNADRLLGTMKKVMSWEDENVVIPIVERTGSSEPYNDFAVPRNVNINSNTVTVEQYRHSTSVLIGSLISAQYGKMKINYSDQAMIGAYETLAIEDNNIYFNGFIDSTANKFKVYGILNNPNLPAYKPASKTFDTMTFQELVTFFANAVQELNTQTQQHVDENSVIRVGFPSNKQSIITAKLINEVQGYSFFYDYLKKTYPNMEIIFCNELVGAYNNQDVCYFIAESNAGGNLETLYGGYSERALMGNLILQDNSTRQAMSNGNAGCILNKPTHVVRYNNV